LFIAAVITIAIFLLLAGCIFGAAGTLSWPMAWAVLAIYAISKAAALIFVNPELIKERTNLGHDVDYREMVFATCGYLCLYPGIFVVAGLDAVRFGPVIPISQSIQITMLFVFALGYGFTFWAVLSNPFFTTNVRIQDDRDHLVITSGPYALIRHPGYAGVLFAHIALPFVLGSIWAFLPAIVGTIFFILRTSREDQLLQEGLTGYREYQTRVRWRLLPGVW
jgi:protein-S-isoprenylcysteine O-methyltransferase Ste14